MKKGLLVGLAALSTISLASCGNKGSGLKVGVVCIGDETATYDKNFMNALDKVKKDKGIKVFYKYNVSEDGDASYQAAVELAEAGCDIVISNSFGFEANTIKAAKEYPDVQFFHCTGVKAHTEKLANFANGFAEIYEGRYLAGIAAGMKLKEMGETKLGYVGAYPYAEVKSGYTAFYLGAKSVLPEVTMQVQFTNNWGNTNLETAAAENLYNKGAKLISQHADTYGAPSVCDKYGIPNVAYNVSTESKYPNTYLCYSAINWAPCFTHLVECVEKGEHMEWDFSGSLADGAVVVGKAGKCAAPGTQEAMDAAAEKIKNGELKVFDCANFTVNGEHLTSRLADVDDAGDWAPETEAIVTEGGKTFYAESKFRSAPYFDVNIDGISEVTTSK